MVVVAVVLLRGLDDLQPLRDAALHIRLQVSHHHVLLGQDGIAQEKQVLRAMVLLQLLAQRRSRKEESEWLSRVYMYYTMNKYAHR